MNRHKRRAAGAVLVRRGPLDRPTVIDLGSKLDRKQVAPAWGWKRRDGGRAAHVSVASEYAGTTTQVCGLYPFIAGAGAPAVGVPIGLHMHWREVVCLDPFEWVRAGIVTNPGIGMIAVPGSGKSALIKRLITGLIGLGYRAVILGDIKPEYSPLIEALGGQVIRVGRGLGRINPLDSGAWGSVIAQLDAAGLVEARNSVTAELRGRRLNVLTALCALVRDTAVSNAEELMLGAAIDTLTGRGVTDPTIPDVLSMIRDGATDLIERAEMDPAEYKTASQPLRQTLRVLLEGALQGMFDGPTTTPIDMDARAVSIDISAVAADGDNTAIAAAMLCVWAYGFGMTEATLALADNGLIEQRNYLVVMDELWRALRGSPGLVEKADALTRTNRSKGVAQIMSTHSLKDFEALPTEQDRAKARGFFERCATLIFGGLSAGELDAAAPLVGGWTDGERRMVTSWVEPSSWAGSTVHPGRGKYLIKLGSNVGLPVAMSLVEGEAALYETDSRIIATAQRSTDGKV
jgi:hypothetical protein